MQIAFCSLYIDYDPKAEISIAFFKKVQNKIHYAIHGQTAEEVIYTRADAEKELYLLQNVCQVVTSD